MLRAGAEPARRTLEDANADVNLDMLLQFKRQNLDLIGSSSESSLTFTTFDE